MTRDILATVKINLPKPVNFLRLDGCDGAIAVGDIPEEDVPGIAQAIAKQFEDHCAERRKAK